MDFEDITITNCASCNSTIIVLFSSADHPKLRNTNVLENYEPLKIIC